MNENKTIVTTLDFKMTGEKELLGLFQNLNQLFDTEKLKTEGNKVAATLIGIFNNIGKDLMSGTAIDVNNTGVMKGLNQLSALLDKIQVKAVGSSATKVLEELDGKIAAAQARVDKAMESVKRIDSEIEAKKAELLKRMQDGSFGQVFTEDLQEADNVVSKLAEVRKEMEELDAAGKDITGLKKQEESLIRLAQAIQDVNKDLIKLGRSKGGHASQKTQGENALKDLTSQKKDAIAANPKEINDQAKAYQRLYDILELFRALNLDQAVRDETKEREKSNAAVKKATEENEKLTRSVKKGEKTWGRKVIEMFAYQNILRTIKQIWTTSIQVITELDRAMVEAAIVTNMTTKETWKLLGSYQELADIVGRSASEIASLNAFFLQQGLTVKNAMEMTEIAAKSAAIAGISLQESANYLTSAINGFGLAASAAEEVADKFAAVGAATAADFEELAIAMSKVAPVAQSAGVGIDFMMGVLAKGIHTTREAPENIGTAFKTIFARMSELTDMGKAMEDGMSLNRVEKALESVGISLRDQVGQFRSLEDVLYEVGYAWKDLDSLQQNYLATALAGTRQQPRLMAILNDFEETVEFIEISKDSAKAMEYQHMEYMDGMEAASQAVRNAWEGVVTSFSDSSAIIILLEGITVVIKTVANVIGFLNTGFGRFIALVGAVTTLLVIYKTYLGSTVLSTITLSGVNAALALSWEAVKTGIIKATTASIGFMIANWPLLAIAAAIALVVVGFSALSKEIKRQNTLIETNNKLMYESTQREKDLKDTVEEYRKLNAQIHKTNEEMERMLELQNTLSEFDTADGNTQNFMKRDTITGEWILDEKKITQEYANEQAKRFILQDQLKEKLKNDQIWAQNIANNKAAGFAVSEKNIQDALEESIQMFDKFGENLIEAGFEAGKNFASDLLDGADLRDFEKTFSGVIKNIGRKEFVDENGLLSFENAEKVGKDIAAILSEAYKPDPNAKKDLNTFELLTRDAERYSTILKDITKLGYDQETMNNIITSLRMEYEDEATMELLQNKGISLEIVADFIDRGGKMAELQSLLKSIGMVEGAGDDKFMQDQKTRENDIAQEFKDLDDEEAKAYKDAEKRRKRIFTRDKTTEKQLADKLAKIKSDREALMREQESFVTDEQHALAKVLTDDRIKQLMNGENLTQNIKVIREALVESGRSTAEANAYIQNEILGTMYRENAESIANYGKTISSTFDNVLKLDEDMAKGDFTSYLNLVEELGEEGVRIVDDFLDTGNPEEILDKMTENLMDTIKERREILDGLYVDGAEKGTADYEKNLQIDKERAQLDIMASAYQNINRLTAVYDRNLKNAAETLKSATDYLKTYESLMEAGFGEDSSIVGFFKGFGDMLLEDAFDKSLDNVDMIFGNVEDEIARLKEARLMDKDGKFEETPQGQKAKKEFEILMQQAAEALEASAGIVMKQIDANNKEFAVKIKESNEQYKNLVDSMKKYHDTRWNEVDYENRLLDLQKNITDARNKLSSAQIGGTQKQMQDAQEELRRMQQERRKAIEDESIKRLEEDLEKQRKEAEDKLEKEKMQQNELLIDKLSGTEGAVDALKEAVLKNTVALEKETKTNSPVNNPSNAPTGGGKGSQVFYEKLMV